MSSPFEVSRDDGRRGLGGGPFGEAGLSAWEGRNGWGVYDRRAWMRAFGSGDFRIYRAVADGDNVALNLRVVGKMPAVLELPRVVVFASGGGGGGRVAELERASE